MMKHDGHRRNDEARRAQGHFEECEGIDLDPAAGVTVGSLISAVQQGRIDPKKNVLLNITGGGYKRVQEMFDCIQVPVGLATNNTTNKDEIARFVSDWVNAHA
ncbi:MAG: hypothetical protein NTV68_08160 [Methanomicrobiales archaeon]|nr:hypothetical protein [Methanomicrobiales archaeon]